MAKKAKRINGPAGALDDASEPRSSISVRNAVLLSGFLALVVISIFTVMLPELTDDGAEDEADARGQTDEDTTVGDDANGDSSPTASTP